MIEKKKPKKKQKSIARLANDAADLLQKLVRMKAAIPSAGGMCACVTCGKLDHWKNLQGGHFIQRGKLSTKLVEENIHPQCGGCNLYRMKEATGVLEYRRFMVATYGEQFVQELEQLAKQPKKFMRYELESLIDDLKTRIRDQEQRLGI